MRSRLKRLLFVLLLLGSGWITVDIVRSGDPVYRVRELSAFGRYQKYDPMILETAQRHGVDPALVKAVVWRESRFRPHTTGGSGERGLMQVMEGAATDWVRANRIETFQPTDLFSPFTNVEVGTWYLANAFKYWGEADDPVPYALAEYNAGRSRAVRWGESERESGMLPAEEMLQVMEFPGTRRYIESIVDRAKFYRDRKEFEGRGEGGG